MYNKGVKDLHVEIISAKTVLQFQVTGEEGISAHWCNSCEIEI